MERRSLLTDVRVQALSDSRRSIEVRVPSDGRVEVNVDEVVVGALVKLEQRKKREEIRTRSELTRIELTHLLRREITPAEKTAEKALEETTESERDLEGRKNRMSWSLSEMERNH